MPFPADRRFLRTHDDFDLASIASPVEGATHGLVIRPDYDPEASGPKYADGVLPTGVEGDGGGFVLARSGIATVEHPNTSVIVPHGISVVPVPEEVQVTPHDTEDGWLDGAASAKFAVTHVDADDLTISVDAAPGSGKHATFGWLWVRARGFEEGDYPAAVLEDSPLGYWRLGEDTGTSAADETAGARDGTYTNSPTLGVDGLVALESDTAVSFLASSSQFVVLPDESAFDFASGDFSVEFWIQASGGDSFAGTIAKGNNAWRFLRFPATGTGLAFVSNAAGTHLVEASSVLDGNVHHIVGVFEGGTLRIYRDGVQVATRAGSTLSQNNEPVRFASATGAAQFLTGTLDEVAIYSFALQPDRIALHHAIGRG